LREYQNTHFIFNHFFFKNGAIYDTMWKNMVQPGRPQMTIWCMRIACWINKATDTHSEHVILIAFPQQQFVSKTHLSVKLSLHCLCSSLWPLDIPYQTVFPFLHEGACPITSYACVRDDVQLLGQSGWYHV
jgi:hypothetical protein